MTTTDAWELMIIRTLAALLEFGGDLYVRTTPRSAHTCDRSCRRLNPDAPSGQTALHLAAASKFNDPVVSFLLDNKVKVDQHDDERYLD